MRGYDCLTDPTKTDIEAGNFTVCAFCYIPLIFTENLCLREITVEEILEGPPSFIVDLAFAIAITRKATEQYYQQNN